MAPKRPAMQTWRRIEARYWPTDAAQVARGCFFCERRPVITHIHIDHPKRAAA